MCGFCGFTGSLINSEEVLNSMMNKIVHRGPDSEGTYIGDKVCLGFRRLSIIGLSDGYQPLSNEDGNIIIVFNGEIYNYLQLKEDLIDKGHTFKTHCDTEVLVHAYEEYGRDMLNYLRGMFAFVIYDKALDLLLCARDFFGIKPFYYSLVDGNFVFGSEIKSILEYSGYTPVMNEDALENYLTFQYSVLEETFFKGIYKLMPGHLLTFQGGKVEVKRYFECRFDEKDGTLEDFVEEIDKAMLDSLSAHKVSDVEVGSFLSSGVDSSYVAACFNGDKTFTVGFDYEKYNEIDYAKVLSDKIGITNYSKTISTDEYWDALPKVQYHMDEPLADPSAVALYFVSQLASKHVKVSLSGEGADEFFGGYNIYKEPLSLKSITRLPRCLRKFLGAAASCIPFSIKGKNFFIRGSKDVEERFIGNAYMFTKKERDKILKQTKRGLTPQQITKPYYEKVKDKDDITKMQYIDLHMWMVGDILLKADKMSMAHSLEVRVPFLDKHVWKVASSIPIKYRVNKQNTKYAMRLAANRHLPDEVAAKKKLGFPVPIRIWLKDEKYYGLVKGYFMNETANKYFEQKKLTSLLEKHKSGKRDNSRKIWTIFMFLIWHEQFFEGKAA